MKKWYNKYLTVFEKPFESASSEVIEEVKVKLAKKQSKEPLATIAVIAHNEETRLLSCLWSLADTTCQYPIEIIGVDNNSIDKTHSVFDTLGVPAYFEERKSSGYARNCGLQNAKGKYYICIDSDTIYPPAYIQLMIDALQEKDVVAVFGLWSFILDKNHSPFGLKVYEFIRDIHLYFQSLKRPELSVRGMSFAHRTDLGLQIGYRVDLKRGEDGSMLLELKQYGKTKFITSSEARVLTSSGTFDNTGSIKRNLWLKMKKAFLQLPYFRKKDKYKDDSSNLI